MRWAIPLSLLLLAAAQGAVLGVPLHVDVRIAGALPAEPVSVVLRVRPQKSFETETSADLHLPVSAPGRETLNLRTGIWRLQGEAKGYWSEEQIVSLRDGEEGSAQVRFFRTGTLRAKLDPPRGEELPDRLEVRFGPVPGAQPRDAASAADGTVSCPVRGEVWECEVPASMNDVRLRAEAMMPLYRWGVRVEAGKTLDLGVLALRSGASASGRVLTEKGLPATGSKVTLAPESHGVPSDDSTGARLEALALETRTNDRGFFQFQGVAPGTYAVTAVDEGMAPARVSPVVVREGLEVRILDPLILAPPLTLRIEVSPPVDPWGNSWRIRLSREVVPAAMQQAVGEGDADREGRWVQRNVAGGKYLVTILGDLGSRWVSQEIDLVPGDVPISIEIPLIEVRGLVWIGATPLAATVWLGGRSGFRRIRFDSDQEGIFHGFLPEEGTWAVDLVSEVDGLDKLALEPVEVRVPRGKRVAEVEILVPDTTLEGEVVDEAGRPVPGAFVGLTGKKTSQVTADEDGKFKVRGLAPPSVVVEAEEGDRSTGPVQAILEEGRKSPWLRLVLRQNLEVRGRIVSSAGPVPGAEVMAFPTMGQVALSSSVTTVTGPDGSFSLRVPAATRSVGLFVAAPGHAFHMARVPVDRDRLLEIPIETTGGTLVVKLPQVKGDGPPPSPLLVHGGTFTPLLLLSRWTSQQRFQQTDPGKLIIPNMESGAYSVCLRAGPEISQGKEPPPERCDSGSLMPNGELTLAPPQPGS